MSQDGGEEYVAAAALLADGARRVFSRGRPLPFPISFPKTWAEPKPQRVPSLRRVSVSQLLSLNREISAGEGLSPAPMWSVTWQRQTSLIWGHCFFLDLLSPNYSRSSPFTPNRF